MMTDTEKTEIEEMVEKIFAKDRSIKSDAYKSGYRQGLASELYDEPIQVFYEEGSAEYETFFVAYNQSKNNAIARTGKKGRLDLVYLFNEIVSYGTGCSFPNGKALCDFRELIYLYLGGKRIPEVMLYNLEDYLYNIVQATKYVKSTINKDWPYVHCDQTDIDNEQEFNNDCEGVKWMFKAYMEHPEYYHGSEQYKKEQLLKYGHTETEESDKKRSVI